jgi:hypothetical protein
MAKVKLGVKKSLFGRYSDVTGLVCIEYSPKMGEEIIIYGDTDKKKKLGVVNCGLDIEARERLEKLDGKIASFRSKPPTENKEHGKQFVPYTTYDSEYLTLGFFDVLQSPEI